MSLKLVVLLASIAGIVGIALGYYLRMIISLGKRGSMELQIKSMELAGKEEAKKIILHAQEEATKVLHEARVELKEKEEITQSLILVCLLYQARIYFQNK